jgi:ABC-type transport system involved in Fe-S cluster assembly fused permease/ATPase subunit
MLFKGEKRRVAIACLFLKDLKIILLNKAISAIDTKTEEQI